MKSKTYFRKVTTIHIKMASIKIKKKETKKTTKQYKMTIHDLPNDIHLNIVNYLSLNGSIQFGILLNNQKGVHKHLLSKEYMVSYLKRADITDLCNLILKEMITMIQRIVRNYENSSLRPIRLNTTNGTIYTLYPRNLSRSFFVSNIKIPAISNKSFTISFQSITRNITEIYYGGLDVLAIVVDDEVNRTRNIFVRIPYDCEEYTYGFAVNIVRILGKIIMIMDRYQGWKVECSYMLYTSNVDDVNVRPVCPNYKTRAINPMNHEFFHALLNFSLSDLGYEYHIRPWTNKYSVVHKQATLVKYPPHKSYGVEIMLQNNGFPSNNEIITDIYLNIQNGRYYEVYHPDDHANIIAFKQRYEQQVHELQQGYDENIEIPEN